MNTSKLSNSPSRPRHWPPNLAALLLLAATPTLHAQVSPDNQWPNSTFEEGTDLDLSTGTPTGWARGGNNPTLCEVSSVISTSPTHALMVNDTDSQGYAEWYSNLNIQGLFNPGETLTLQWQQLHNISGGEMRVTVLFWSATDALLSQNHFVVQGNSPGWNGDLASSTFSPRTEALTVPGSATRLQISLVSGGAPSTTGVMLIDDLSLTKPRQPILLPGNFWVNSTFEAGSNLDDPTGTPSSWNRGGSDPSINQVTTELSQSPTHALAALDSDPTQYGEWYSDLGLGGRANPGDSLRIQWFEAYHIENGEMRVSILFFDPADAVIGENHFVAKGQSEGWTGTLATSPLTRRETRLTVPENASKMRVSLVSGGPSETLGQFVLDDLSVAAEPNTLLTGNVWPNPTFEEGSNLNQPTGTPTAWNRGGNDPSINQVASQPFSSTSHSLAVVDNNPAGYGEWYANLPLNGLTEPGGSLRLQWFEAFQISDGGEMRLTFLFWSPENTLLAEKHFVARGQSPGWNENLAAITMTRRTDRLLIPPGASRLQVSLVSGGPSETTGRLFIDDLSIVPLPPGIVLPNNFWPNPTFEEGTGLDDPSSALPTGWGRGGSDGRVCQVSTAKAVSGSHSLAVVDDNENGYGEWYQTVALDGKAAPGDTLELQWFELFNTTADMRVTVLFFKNGGALAQEKHFVVRGQSPGWNGTVASSPFHRRFERLTVPEEAVSMLVSLVSAGPLNGKGVMLIDDLSVRVYRADFDSDQDGATDGDEALAGTDPFNAASVLSFTSIQAGTQGLELQWQAVADHTYALYSSESVTGNFTPVPGAENITVTESGHATFLIPGQLKGPHQYYRIQLITPAVE